MTKFYTGVARYGNNILLKEISNGKSVIKKIKYQPSFYVKTNDAESQYRTMYNEPLKRVKFETMADANEYIKRYENVENHEFFGNKNFIYQFICDAYPSAVDFDLTELGIWTIDIETKVELGGFPHPAEAAEEILLITMLNNKSKKYITWGRKKFSITNAPKVEDFDISKIDLEYRCFSEEADMLNDFMFWWKNSQIDCLTGWNTEGFDIPYLYNRCLRILGEDSANDFSPFCMVKERSVRVADGEFTTYDFLGMSLLDYQQLYKKFTYTTRESYKLGHIGDVELGVKKIDLGFSFRESYQDENWDTFVIYNIRDVEIVDKLEDRLGLIQLAYTIAYDAKCLPNDVFGAVKTWDCMMYRFMLEKNIIVPQKKSVKSWNIVGAYVKEPKPGQYSWIASFDAASLYPTIIMQYNMSPETVVEMPMRSVTVDGLLTKDYDLSDLVEKAYGMAANGQMFKNNVKGLFPEIVSKQFSDRKMYKKQMQKAEAAFEHLKAEKNARASGSSAQNEFSSLTDAELASEYNRINKEIAKFNNFQMAKKILMNSLYGAMGNQGFRFYDPRVAEAITLTGQYFIRAVGDSIDTFMEKITKVKGEATFYQDTDSCYVTLKNIVDKFIIPKLGKDFDVQKVIDAMDKIADEKITPVINAACDDIAKYTNSLDQLMNFKREALADRGVWCAKKKYALNVYDNEGVRYAEPKIKIMGLEIVRSSTPAPVRKMLKDAVTIVLNGTEEELQGRIDQWKTSFLKHAPEEIAFPRGVQRLEQYSDPGTIFKKGCPIHVRAALLFNHNIKKASLDNIYPLIQDGDKIKFLYMKTPNILRENVFGFIDKYPRELKLDKYIDYETMWEKAFLAPLDSIIGTIGWKHEKINTLADLFA